MLISMSLVDRDPETDTLSIHRVIQLEFRKSLDEDTRRKAFRLASTLLLAAFPTQVNGLSLRKEWPRCVLYIQHITTLAKHFQVLEVLPSYPGEFLDFAMCLSNAAWYDHQNLIFPGPHRFLTGKHVASPSSCNID